MSAHEVSYTLGAYKDRVRGRGTDGEAASDQVSRKWKQLAKHKKGRLECDDGHYATRTRVPQGLPWDWVSERLSTPRGFLNDGEAVGFTEVAI